MAQPKTKQQIKSKSHNTRLWNKLRPVGILMVFVVIGLVFLRVSHAAFIENRASCTNLALSSTSVGPGQTIRATFTLNNTGTTYWSSPDYYITDHYGAVGITYGASFGTTHPPGGPPINVTIGVQAPRQPGSYLVGPQVATHSSGAFNSPCNGLTLNVVAPSPQPQPQPQPHPQPVPKKTTPKAASPAPAAPADTAPPSTPDNLQASVNDADKSINLSWSASTDNTSVVGYTVERSESDQGWTVLSDNISDTTFEDTGVKFGTSYDYRVRAFDAAQNYSDYATTTLDSAGFKSNVDPKKDSTVTAEDGITAVIVPAGAAKDSLFCFIDASVTAGLPNVSGYRLVNGPYDFACRDAAGSTVNSFSSSPILTVQTKKIKVKGVASVSAFGYVNGQWTALKSSTKNHVLEAKLDNTQTYAIMGKKQTTPVWITILIILLILAAIAGIIVFVLRYLARRKYQEQYDDYRNKQLGG